MLCFRAKPPRPLPPPPSRRSGVWVSSSSARKYSTSRLSVTNSSSGRPSSIPSLLARRNSELYSANDPVGRRRGPNPDDSKELDHLISPVGERCTGIETVRLISQITSCDSYHDRVLGGFVFA